MVSGEPHLLFAGLQLAFENHSFIISYLCYEAIYRYLLPNNTFIPGQTPSMASVCKTEAPGVLASLPRCRRNPDEKKRRVQKDEKEVGKRQPNRSAKKRSLAVKFLCLCRGSCHAFQDYHIFVNFSDPSQSSTRHRTPRSNTSVSRRSSCHRGFPNPHGFDVPE